MEKITALEKTIYNLENDVYKYGWYGCNTCNCGVLAKTLLGGRDVEQCGFNQSPSIGNWGAFSKHALCLTTNLPLPEIFQILKDTGFTHQELFDLEFLGNPKIAEACGFKLDAFGYGFAASSHYERKNSLIKYLKAWVKILKEEKLSSEQNPEECDATKMPKEPEARPKKEYTVVYIDNEISTQSKKLIMS